MQREIVIGDEHPKGKIVDVPGRMQSCRVDITTQVDGRTVLKIHMFVAENAPEDLRPTQAESPFRLCSCLLYSSCGRRAGQVVEDQPGSGASGRNRRCRQISPARPKGGGD